ncbi:MAG: tetratricopeptide repeat protein [Alphaproteobacteria bacterium]|nr:tetratricopeptide repeat protein [Alphaproteobacteria bacterium]
MNEIDSFLDAAFLAYNDGRVDEAEELVRRVLNIEPTHGDGLYLLGLIAFQSGALDPASDLLYQAVKLYPQQDNYALALASVLQKQNRLDEALSFYEKYKDNPLVLAQMGMIYAKKRQTEWAHSAFSKAIELDKGIADAYIGLAMLAKRENNFEKSEQLLLQSPQTPDVLYRLASLYRHMDNPSKALTYINNALSSMNNYVFLNEKGLILEALGQDEEALRMYLSATDMNTYYADAFANQGNIYLKRGQHDLAEDAYKRALALDNKFFMAHHNLATLLYRQGRKYEALDHYQEAVIIDSKNMSAVYNLGIIQEDVGEFSEAAGLYFNALVGSFENPALEFRIASVLERLFKSSKDGKKQALDFVKGWVKHFPDSVVALHTQDALLGKKSSDKKDIAKAYAEKLYDVFASEYNECMKKMQASVIDAAAEMIQDKQFDSVLDLACGTGTFGLKLKQNFNTLLGVDISQKMLDEAQKTSVYDKLEHMPIDDYFQSSNDKFDLIMALEVTGYLDNLSELFEGAKTHLHSDGQFIFSIEYPLDKNETELSVNGRYLYSMEFTKQALEKAGLTVAEVKEINLRREGNDYAKGAVLIATPHK